MKTIHKAYKFELKPTPTQKVLLEKHFGCVRFVYNHFLNERMEQYKATNTSDNYYTQSKALTQLKKQEETRWLKEVSSKALEYALQSLDVAYQNFYRKNSKYPKFKSKKRSRDSYTVWQSLRLQGDKIIIPKFREGIKCIVHREVQGTIRKMTISKTPTGRYFVSILTEQQHQPTKKTGEVCGVDLGLKHFAVTSDGIKFENHKYTKKYARALAIAQKHLSRKTKGSNSYERQRRKVAKIHEKIANSRRDVLHKLSHQLVSDYDLIAVETLNIKGMVKNRKLAKHINDASWYTFVQFLEYKANWNDKQVVKVGRFYPSTKTCHVCGVTNEKLTLSVREWTCENGHQLDRDENAAINILNEGLRITSSGAGDYTSGD